MGWLVGVLVGGRVVCSRTAFFCIRLSAPSLSPSLASLPYLPPSRVKRLVPGTWNCCFSADSSIYQSMGMFPTSVSVVLGDADGGLVDFFLVSMPLCGGLKKKNDGVHL